MADPVRTLACDTTPVDITAQTYCRRIVVEENYNSDNAPTADLRQYKPAGSTTPIRVPKGTSAIFTGPGRYYPGQTVGQIRTESGSITLRIKEEEYI